MQVLGILGGIASGKSTVTAEFAKLGAVVIDADRLGHAALETAEVQSAIRAEFGTEVFEPDGSISRPRLAGIVFASNPEANQKLQRLEQIIHPVLTVKLHQQLKELADKNVFAVILDAPVLLKAGWKDLCDKLIYIDTPHEIRFQRVLSRGWTEQEFAAREAAQESLKFKREIADLVIDNSESLISTQAQVKQIWHSLGFSA